MYRSLTIAALLALAPLAAPRAQSFQGVGVLPVPGGGSPSSFAFGVSGTGGVVSGYSRSAAGNEAFRWTSGGMASIGDLPGGTVEAIAYGVSEDGSTLVGYGTSAAGPEAFRWTASGLVGLGDFPGGTSYSVARAVSADGAVVVGTGYPGSSAQAFRWTEASGLVALGDLPGGSTVSTAYGVSADGRVVVGSGTSTAGTEAFRWAEDTGMVGMGSLGGAPFFSVAHAVSSDSTTIVGQSRGATLQAFRWTRATGMVGLPCLPDGESCGAYGVSGDGRVVVGYDYKPGTGPRAVVWSAAGTPYPLRDLLVGYGLDLTGWSLSEAKGISADGTTVVGSGGRAGGALEGWRAVILPLPTAAEPGATDTDLALSVAPNPARGAAVLTLRLDAAQSARVAVYDLLGRPVARLHDGLLAAGTHGFRFSTEALPAGVYVVRAAAGDAVLTRRLTVAR